MSLAPQPPIVAPWFRMGSPPLSSLKAHDLPSQYILLSLQRPSTQIRWGLTLSLFHGTHVLVGNVSQELLSSMVRESYVRSCRIDPNLFWGRAGQANVQAWTAFLTSDTSSRCGATGIEAPSSPPTLLPGDCILAMNGRPTMMYGSSLRELTEYMKEQTFLTVLVHRHARASQAAAAALQDRGGLSSRSSTLAANAAFQVLQELFHGPATAVPQRVPHVVTPPRVSPHSWAFPWQLPPRNAAPPQRFKTCVKPESTTPTVAPVLYRNPLFTDDSGKDIPFEDDWEFDVGESAQEDTECYLRPIGDFDEWLRCRKYHWRKRYRAYSLSSDGDGAEASERSATNVPMDFWSNQGYTTFDRWLAASKRKWKNAYSWNQRKRRRIERECEQSVSLANADFGTWLQVRKKQWLVLRRKRHRQRLEAMHQSVGVSPRTGLEQGMCVAANGDAILVDAILDELEQKERELKSREPLDLNFFFDEESGIPDDVIAHTFRFLDPLERPNLLSLCRKMRISLCRREDVWRQLCESHWKLPRRPRKPWHEIYFGTLRVEIETARMKVDGLLTKASSILLKGDQLQAIEKLVGEAESDFDFDINESSGVVCERNSLLNLAVIHQRHKVVRWLVDARSADIETSDRGQFTPLMNAAWAGDRQLVRFFLMKGADRWKVGTCHYTRPLASPDFKGLNAAQWADKRGFPDIAKLITMGL